MENNNFIVNCPHCKDIIIIEQVNCAIFRHGVLKLNNEQIPPHLNKLECDKLFNCQLIYGCGKPFKVIEKNNLYIAIKCDYI